MNDIPKTSAFDGKRGFVGFIMIFGFSISIPVIGTGIMGFPTPSLPAFLLALIAIFTLCVKFFFTDLLSSEGWTIEKSSLDMSVALSAALTSLGILQQFEQTKLLFPLALSFGSPSALPALATPTDLLLVRQHLWLLTVLAWLSVCTAGRLTWSIRKGKKAWPRQIFCAILLMFTFAIYYILILYKA